MTLPDIGPAPLREVERITDVGFDVGYACLALWQAWVRVVLRAPLRYSVAAEAAELLRQRQTDGGPSAQRPAHRSED